MVKRKLSRMGQIRVIGAWVAVLSLAAGLIANFLFSFALMVIGPLFVIGALSFIVSQSYIWIGHRSGAAG